MNGLDHIIRLLTTACANCKDWPLIGTPSQPGRAECKCREPR